MRIIGFSISSFIKNEMDKPELIGNIIDIFEDFLDDKGIIIPNPEKDEDPELDMESPANIYGEDYDSLSTSLENLLQSWKVIEPSEPVSNLDVDVLWLYYMWWTICAEYFDN